VTAARAPRPVQESATARLSRLLTMVPWLLAHQGVDVDVAAAQFGVTREQLESDLALLFVCGTPGHLPDDLIEADWEDGRVYVGNADAISRPLRFTLDEALTLMVGLRALAATPGVTGASGADGGEAILRALAKLEEATGEAAGVAARVRVTLDDGAAAAILADASRAVQEHRRVRLRYQSFGRDEVTERDVDPMRVISLDARWYLEGWCHRAEDVRLFRLDRVQSLAVLDADGTPPETAQPRDLAGETYQPSPDDLLVELVTEASAAWVGDYYPVDSVTDLGSGRRRVRLRVADPAWVRRLAWRLGGQVSVVAPAGVADDIARGATAALAAYPPQVVAGLGLSGMPPAPEGGG
jgi:proteasome accessory factor C